MMRAAFLAVSCALLIGRGGVPLVAAEPPPALDATDQRAVELALRGIKMTPHDLGFKKDNVESGWVLPQPRSFLKEPLGLPRYSDATLVKLRRVQSLRGIADFAAGEILFPISLCNLDNPHRLDPSFLRQLPPAVGQAVQQVYAAALRARSLLRSALPADNITRLSVFGVETFRLDQDPAELDSWDKLGLDTNPERELIRRNANLDTQDSEMADAILIPCDLQWMFTAFHELANAVDKTIRILQAAKDDPAMHREFRIETDTPLGKIIVGGAGNNVYRDEAFLIIDTGGDDVYENSAGGANGLVGRPISIVIDMGGSDQFISRRSFSQGSGVFGIGILAALGSNCVFEAKHLSQGAGFFGCGLLMTGPGKQTFEGDTFCQGAGMFGTGILWQRGGDTTYKANQMAQGFGGVQGVGLLLDESGNDTYMAGGKVACPWLPGHFFSLAQGFGYGMRPFAGGGIGILCDLKGDDHYVADVYGQGASYWYSVGLLLDAEGNDTYEAYQYCQGAGIHLSSGALIDWSGNDSYKAFAICQGAAHDYSVGMLIDRAGNDRYTGESTAQGSAINNSFALLFDRAGDDVYVGGAKNISQAAGNDGGRREYGSIALLLDLGGKDSYSQGQGNNAMWIKPLHGAGLDCEASLWSAPTHWNFSGTRSQEERQSGGESPHSKLPKAATVDPHHPTERLLRLAISERSEAIAAWNELKHLGTEALPYLITRLDSPNVMVRVKIEELIDSIGTNAAPVLAAGIDSAKNDEVARICCYFLARFESATGAVPHVLPLLQREKLRATALYTLGHLRAQEAFQPALESLRDKREIVRLRAAQALGRIGDRRAIPKLISALDDELWDVRYAAEDALVALGWTGIGPLRHAFDHSSRRARDHILDALARLGDAEAMTMARAQWRGEDPLVRAALMKNLAEQLPPKRR